MKRERFYNNIIYIKKGMAFFKTRSVRRAVGKTYRKARKVVKRRYGRKGGVARLAKDVMYLKSVLNPEKKRYQITYTSGLAVGQVIGNGAGYYAVDITPIPAIGSGYNARTGASIKLHATHFTFSLQQQSSSVNGIKVRVEIWLIKGNAYSSASTFVTDHYQLNQFVLNAGSPTIVDYNSDIDPDEFAKAKKLREFHIKLPNDQVSQTQIKMYKNGIKYMRGKGHHVRYDTNTTTIMNGQLLMLIFADNGNASGATACTLTGVPITSTSTGVTLNYDILHYYYDN